MPTVVREGELSAPAGIPQPVERGFLYFVTLVSGRRFLYSGSERGFPSLAHVVRCIGHEANLGELIANADDRTAILLGDQAVKFGAKNKFAGQRVAFSVLPDTGLTKGRAIRERSDVDECIGLHFCDSFFEVGGAWRSVATA